jgi:2-dehydropantoate 2-reductase
MKIAIFGVGGVGGYFGGMLARTEHEVSFVARGGHLAAIRQQGLRLSSDKGEFIIHPHLVTDSPAEIGPVDVVVVATKTWQIEEAIQQMQPLVGPQTTIIPLLNGVEAPAQLAEVYGQNRVLGGFCRVLSLVKGPGHIHQGGTHPFVAFGELDKTLTPRLQALQAVFAEAEITVEVSPDIEAAMWQKLVFIAAMSGVGAVTRSHAGLLRRVPQAYQLLRQTMQEIVAVAQGRGIGLQDDAVAKGMATFDNLPDEATASMQRDIMEGRPSELEGQNGAVVRLGAEVGVATPLNLYLYYSLLPQEMKARGLVS